MCDWRRLLLIQALATGGTGLHGVSWLPSVSTAWIEGTPPPVDCNAKRCDSTEMLPAEDVDPEGRHGWLVVDSEGRGLRLSSCLASGRTSGRITKSFSLLMRRAFKTAVSGAVSAKK